jgi:Na+-driven multidrug efflux pump
MGSSLNGAGDTVSPLLITTIVMYCVKLPLAYLFSVYLPWEITGIWLAIVISYLLYAFAMTFWFTRGKWKEKKV